MGEIFKYFIVAIILIVVLSVVLSLLKLTVAIMFYVFIGVVIFSGVAYLYNRFIKR